jgi:hypothetical protein
MPKSFGAATIAYGPRAVPLDEGENPTSSADNDCVKTLHFVLELDPATAIIDLPNANVNGAAHGGLAERPRIFPVLGGPTKIETWFPDTTLTQSVSY